MSIPSGLEVTKLVNGMNFVTLSTGEALLCEEEVDRLNTPYTGYGYAKDLSNNNQPIVILSEQIKENEWVLYSGVDVNSQWKAIIEGKKIIKAYLELEFKGTEKRIMQFAFAVSPDFVEWLEAVIGTQGIIGIMDRLDYSQPIEAIQVTEIPLDLPEAIIKSRRNNNETAL